MVHPEDITKHNAWEIPDPGIKRNRSSSSQATYGVLSMLTSETRPMEPYIRSGSMTATLRSAF